MKKLTYDYDKMRRAGALMNRITVTGVENFRLLAELADILDSGELSEETEAGKVEYKRGAPPGHKKSPEGMKQINQSTKRNEVNENGISDVLPADGLAEPAESENGAEPDKSASC